LAFNIISFLSPLGAFLLSSEITSSSGLWMLIIEYGLGQPYAFPFPESIIGTLNPIMGHLVDVLAMPIATVAIFITSIKIIMARRGEEVNRILWRLSISLMLFILSIDILKFILEAGYLVFASVWDYGSINWFAAMNSSQILEYLRNFSSGGNTLSAILLSSGYFAATFFLLSFLMLRDALLLVFIVILPIASLLLAISEFYDRIIQLWVMFIELAFIPFPIAIALYLSAIYSNVFFMHIAFLWAACLIPSILMAKGGILRNLMGLDVLSGITMLGNRIPMVKNNIEIPSLGKAQPNGNLYNNPATENPYQLNIPNLMKSEVEYRRVME
jgi:hypothetical protein